jgi:Asp-tRNA(Asn)/Glu-tRNA(Gln) amidotransferase A subunit family amidase
MALHEMTAAEAVGRIKDGAMTSEDLVRACLDHISATDEAIQAWIHLDGDLALEQARAMDRLRQGGKPLGSLHGVPVGVKDIFDTTDMPTEYGSVIHQGRTTTRDSTVVAKLREAGAVIMGKTVTAEFAFRTPGRTANPHDSSRTPGGSSSGSAAAVAAGQVPLAVGSQTNGSVVRPASFCGIVGLKPTQGMVSRHGVLQTSESLDQIGGFARTVEDVALLTDAMTGVDVCDDATYARPKPDLSAGWRADPPMPPLFALVNLPYDDKMSDDVRGGMAELRDVLGGQIEEVDLPDGYEAIIDHHQIVHEYEVRRNLARQFEDNRGDISPELLEILERGGTYTEQQYADALDAMATAKAYFAEFFNDYDAILTPSAAGVAPSGLDWTGDPIFCTMWTFAGLPSLSLPVLAGESGLPVGVQLVGGPEEDGRLCRTARWLLSALSDASPD